jgi:hypothetical protein
MRMVLSPVLLRLLSVAKRCDPLPKMSYVIALYLDYPHWRLGLLHSDSDSRFDLRSMMSDRTTPISDAVSRSMVDLQTTPSGNGAEIRGDLQPSEGRLSAWSCNTYH